MQRLRAPRGARCQPEQPPPVPAPRAAGATARMGREKSPWGPPRRGVPCEGCRSKLPDFILFFQRKYIQHIVIISMASDN